MRAARLPDHGEQGSAVEVSRVSNWPRKGRDHTIGAADIRREIDMTRLTVADLAEIQSGLASRELLGYRIGDQNERSKVHAKIGAEKTGAASVGGMKVGSAKLSISKT
jgi:hypothetical protein